MGTTYTCPYCSWQGSEPELAEFGTFGEFQEAMQQFIFDQENHECSLAES